MFTLTQVRKLISDFAIILAILIFCGVDMLVGVDTPKLTVPSEFKVSSSCMLKGFLFWWLQCIKADSLLWEIQMTFSKTSFKSSK